MRHHDIERLKEAASLYKADATCLGDIEELVDYAIDVLKSPSTDKEDAAAIARRCVEYYHGGYALGPEWDAYKHGMRTVVRAVQEWAGVPVDLPATPHTPHRVNNNDGTETWYGLPVVVPVGLIPDDETPVEVRSRCLPITSRFIAESGRVEDPVNCRTDEDPAELCIILGRKPQPVTWTPPASLPDGEYRWDGESFEPKTGMWSANKHLTLPLLFGDWKDPPRVGRYRKEGRTATWIGE